MSYLTIATASIMFGIAQTAAAQVSPVQRQLPTIQAPVEREERVEIPERMDDVRTVPPRQISAARTKQTATANTEVRRPGIRIMDFDNTNQGDYQIRFIVPDIADTPASEIIVERQGICGWTASSFDGSDAPQPSRDNSGCAYYFDKYSEAVAALVDRPPVNRHYYALVVDKYNRATERFSDYMSQPVMVVVRGPGARMTRHKLEVLPVATRVERRVFIDKDGDGFQPISAGGDDCDDNDQNRFPGNSEVPNDIDEDCDPYTIGGLDRDGDGFIDWNVSNPAFGSRRTPLRGRDCNDLDPAVRPTAAESLTDNIDNNCDGDVDFVAD